MRRRAAAAFALAAFALAALPGCATLRGSSAGPETSPLETYRGVLGRNPGLSSLRAVVEARIAYAGHEVSLPGVLSLDSLAGFRLELLDPLDRPVAVIFDEGQRVVQYRPAQRLGASLGLFPASCRGVSAMDWVAGVLSASSGPSAGEQFAVRSSWFGERTLDRTRDGAVRESVRFAREGDELVPRLFTWYCDEELALQLRVRRWLQAGGLRLPSVLVVEYPLAGLSATLELREIEGNPAWGASPLHPRLDESTRWITWRLPQ